ncbi:phosphotransferase enzyme family protein [Candidatus Galacturonibacter soehngenii]|uniref:Phosphotransferase n=1 Tax=Candidatus Galacturonatibacter soehngenii TaxID=2307010 RepID=A0A7V7QHP3_9FIRM|nr:phosphotransferase [Candidatus Galacturonibacter soehngenii]KAB1434491.1 phosphotransferase [Candidatus Galacturonibacter soehngenii]
MLKLKYLFENFELAKEALKNWNHDADTLDEMLSYYRISSNAIYPFRYNGQICFLRLSPTDEKLKKNILGEMEFIEYLGQHSYPVLRPIRTRCGENVIIIDTKWGKYYACAFYRVAGNQINTTDMSHEIMYAYGKALGKLHALSTNYKPSTKKWTHNEVLEWIEEVIIEYNAPSYVLHELKEVKRQLANLLQQADNYGLVHYDFEMDNVFYDEKTKSCSVIDFDDGMYHWFALDVEQVLFSLRDELDGTILKCAEEAFIDGYKSEYDYSEESQNSRPLIRRFTNLFSYARLIRCVAETFDDEPEWMSELRKKLDDCIKELESAMN